MIYSMNLLWRRHSRKALPLTILISMVKHCLPGYNQEDSLMLSRRHRFGLSMFESVIGSLGSRSVCCGSWLHESSLLQMLCSGGHVTQHLNPPLLQSLFPTITFFCALESSKADAPPTFLAWLIILHAILQYTAVQLQYYISKSTLFPPTEPAKR